MPKIDLPPIYIGIDPGEDSGGIAVLQGRSAKAYTMPTSEALVLKQLRALKALPGPGTYVLLEKIQPAIFGIGKLQSAKIYANYRSLKMALIACGFTNIRESPGKEWQAGIGIEQRRKLPNGKKEPSDKWKGRLLTFAKNRYPTLPNWNASRTEQLKVGDALLMAYYMKLLVTQKSK